MGLPRQSGVALVATLIMLSLVTFMVVAFLGVARRERRSVEATLTQGEARNAMEQALARAQADFLARILVNGDKGSYGPMTPTNYQNPVFNTAGLPGIPTNVNHLLARAGTANDWLLNLANLQYDPLVPVYSSYYTNRTPFALGLSETNLGRWYLDLNRNFQFDGPTNGLTGDPPWLGGLEYPNTPHHATNRFLNRYTYYVIPAGKTLDVNLIHNQAKRLAGVTTEGYYRNLGLGAHEMNLAAMLAELNPYWGYSYVPGAGAPSTFAPLARDAFRDAQELLLFRNNNSYNNYPTLNAQFGAAGSLSLTNARFDVRGNGPLTLSSNLVENVDATNVPWPGGTNTSASAQRFFDLNELFLTTRGYSANFTTNLLYLSRTNETTWSAAGDRNRRTTYNLFNSLGVDSWPVDGKLNLNWSNAPFTGTNIVIGSSGGDVSGFTDWEPDYFFYNAAELMLRASLTPVALINTNWGGPPATDVLVTNYYFGTNFFYTNFNQALSVTNIPVHPFSLYTPEVNRLLQFTANLYDATTTNSPLPLNSPAYPTVFRPLFAFNTNGWPSNDFIRIYGYTTNGTYASNLLSYPVTDLSDPNSRLAIYTNATGISATGDGTADAHHLTGIPVIIGARKGYPNFNEYAMQTVFSLTRRMEYAKTNATNFGPLALVNPRPVTTNQSLIVSLYNINAFEAWNSYTAPFPRPLRLVATNTTQIVITNEFGPVFATNFVNFADVSYPANSWLGTAAGTPSFKSFLFTNSPHLALTNYTGGPNPYFPTTNVFLAAGLGGPGLPGYAYATNYPPLLGMTNGGFVVAGLSTFNRGDSNRFPEVRLGITVTNSIVYALIDTNENRIVDFVNLANLVSGMDLAAALSSTNGNLVEDSADRLRRFFDSNRVGGGTNPVNPTIGMSNQFSQCTNNTLSYVSANLAEWTGWRGSVGLPAVALLQREIERFRRFMGLAPDPSFPPNQIPPTGLSIQAPYTATRIVALSTSWEVNDPLVHYTTRDMVNPFRTTEASRLWRKPLIPLMALPPPPGSIFAPGYRPDGNNYPAGSLITPPTLGLNKAYAPWGRAPYTGELPQMVTNFYSVASAAYDQRLKDPGAFNSDQWEFPQRKFANLGWIGRVHRGTPWQTFYLKSEIPNPTNWFYWARSAETMPTNDWRLVDVFSTAISADATRGLLSVNQTNAPAWAAALGGVPVLRNTGAAITPLYITPQTPEFTYLVGGLTNGLINARLRVPMWQPVVNYSAGDFVGYQSNFFGNPLYPFTVYYRALAGSNQFNNPLTSAAYWTPIRSWPDVFLGPISYPGGTIVVRHGVAYYSLQTTGTSAPELTPWDWEAYPHATQSWSPTLPCPAGTFVERLGLIYYALVSTTGSPPESNPANWAPCPPQRSFTRLGGVLSTPELSVQSPYLNCGRTWQLGTAYPQGARVYWQGWYYQAIVAVPVNNPPEPLRDYSNLRSGRYWWPLESPAIARNGGTVESLNDVFVERIPQQTLGLLQVETSPRVVIYAYGQSLRPAERGIHVGGGLYQGMATNYQITGESAARVVVRVDGLPDPFFLPRPLPAGAPLIVQPRMVIESFKLLPADY